MPAGIINPSRNYLPVTCAENQPSALAGTAMLTRETLRRLTTPLAVAAETSTAVPAAISPRYQALRSVMLAWPGLASLPPG